jgi:hypothetical protein
MPMAGAGRNFESLTLENGGGTLGERLSIRVLIWGKYFGGPRYDD